ncbi:MAG: class I SAM-dependent methyltransferase, partial [Opitutaceae bacterium]
QIEDIQSKILQTLLEMDKKEKYSPEIPLQEAVKRQYNISRTLDEYLKKFPTLINYLKRGRRFLEIGAGEGIAYNLIINKYGLDGIATNIEEFENKNFVKAVASNLPFDDNTFDLVISIHSITWEPNQKKAITEVIRVLKPKGKAFINLIKFSEISMLWFGDYFWQSFSIQDFKESYDFNENERAGLSILVEKSKEGDIDLPNNYFLTITKQ